MSQDNAMIVRRFADECDHTGKDRIGSPVCLGGCCGAGSLAWARSGLDVLQGMRAGFPDIVFSIQKQITEEDKVASRFEWTGTHDGDFLGVPATGRAVRVWGIVIDRLEAGRIKDTRIIMDTLGLMIQLGAIPQ